MKLLFAIQCHNFERRLCWQLSSIMQQTCNLSDMVICVATFTDRSPTHDIVVDFRYRFNKPIHSYTYFDVDRFAKRGYVRNDQIEYAQMHKCDWIFFADCDNVYAPTFFSELFEVLKTKDPATTLPLFSRAKAHTDVDATEAALNEVLPMGTKEYCIPNAYLRALQIPTIHKGNKPVAAGCMQVVGLEAIELKNKGLYVEHSKDHHLFNDRQGAKSDIQFRKSMGGCEEIVLPMQIHLNHVRDKEAGRHLEVQR